MEGDPSPKTPAGASKDAPRTATPVGPLTAGPRARVPLWKKHWFGGIMTVLSVALVVAVCVEITRRAASYGKQVVESRPVEARIEIVNPPSYLDRQIINSLLEESYNYAAKDEANYSRARNVLDGTILREFADLYTGVETVEGKLVPRQTMGYNAWISKITEVRREVAKDKSVQAIQIVAQWRQPQAWVRVNEQLYLIDPEGTRLPGDYQLRDRSRSRLLVIAGVDLPAGEGGTPAVPRPGDKWAAGPNGVLGADLMAAMALVDRLKKQPFASQIDAVDMSNHAGRKDARAAWITLRTTWSDATGTVPHVVHWGRPIGEEKYYEVQADVKVKALNDIYRRFSRIDAGREYVDIRTEMVRLAKAPTTGNP